LEAFVKTLTFCLALIASSCTLASGQTYKVLYDFGSVANDGVFPVSNLIADSAGNLYGTTQNGGNSTQVGCQTESAGCGTVFQLSPSSDGTWTETVLYNFCTVYSGVFCLDGAWPLAGLVFDEAGNLYGTTSYGGTGTSGKRYGTVFELSPPSGGGQWTEAVLYNFCAGSNGDCQDGSDPTGQLIFDASGNLYGTTSMGGTGNGGQGTVFELSPGNAGWTHTTLYNFCVNGINRICPDGALPQAGLTFDSSGNLYGTTMGGGSAKRQGVGTVFELSPNSNGWNHTILRAFNPDGGPLGIPIGTISFDQAGNIYSTASGDNGGVFRLQHGTNKQQSFVFSGQNGAQPHAGVTIDSARAALYGTTAQGGSGKAGVVYKIVASGQETVLYNFCQQTNCADGQQPLGSLLEDSSGNLYGTTRVGGANGQGVVFEITP
jgi:uncharacterized repeat protein (TIGR03803 family)